MAGNGPAGGPRPGGRLLLRARRGAGGVRPGPEDRRESGEDDQQSHPAALSDFLCMDPAEGKSLSTVHQIK